jgi:hypothetical protein
LWIGIKDIGWVRISAPGKLRKFRLGGSDYRRKVGPFLTGGDRIMKAINQYADEIVAERMELQMSQIGRAPETERKNSENLRLGEKQNDGNFSGQGSE